MADDDRYLTGSGEVDPEQRSASYATNTSLGPFSGGAILAGQDEGVPMYGGRFTTQLPEGLSATLSRTGQAGAPMEYARDAIRLAKQLEAGQLALEASRVGSEGLPSYGLQYSGQIGREGGAPSYYPQPKGHWFVEAGGTPHTPERHVRGGARFNFADGGHIDAALHAARQHFDEGGFLESLRGMFSGPEVLSTGEKLVDDGRVNWGNPDLPSDFFRADKAALALAKRPTVGEPGNDVTGSVPAREPLTAPRPGVVKATELAPPPPQAFTPVSVEDLSPAPVNIPLNAPERGVPVMGASVAPASFATQPIAYSPEAPAAPAQAAIGKLTARAPQDVEQPATNAQILAAIRANESRNNPKAQNPTSSAGGLYQFLNSTWGNTLRRMDPERFGAYSDRQLRGLKTSADTVDLQHAAANYHLANDIAPRLSKAGVPLTPGSAYLSWFQGPGGAVKAYTAPDDATVAQVFPKTVSANANMRFNGKPYAQWTMSDLRQWADTAMAKRMGRAHGGLIDDALHVVRERHADGEAVGQGQEAPTPEDAAVTIARSQPVTPASLARAWTPPEEAIAADVGPRASEFMQTYPEKLGAAMAAMPGEMLKTAKLPGQVLYGERSFDPHNDEDIRKAMDLAMMMQTGGIGGASARAGETVLGSGPVRTSPATAIKHEGSGIYRVFHGDEPAGTISVAKNGAGNFVSAANLDEPFIGKGIGREAYNLIENEIGRKLAPSPLGISPTASKFWQKRLNEMAAEEKANLFAQTREAGAAYGLPERDVNLRLFGIGGVESLPPIKRADGGSVEDRALMLVSRQA